MGIGDDIMATAIARQVASKTGKRVKFVNSAGRARNCIGDVWLGNPNIAPSTQAGDFTPVVNAPGSRPYIAGFTSTKYTWRTWSKERGDIYLTRDEKLIGAKFAGKVIISPTVKGGASPNKDWGWMHWAKFARLASAENIRLTQLGPYPQPVVFGADWIETSDFRKACAIISRARAVVTHEGAMHHAAAALGVPAVVIFGGYISPEITGYDEHINLFTGGTACGLRQECAHCRMAMDLIAPQMVLNGLLSILSSEKGYSDGS